MFVVGCLPHGDSAYGGEMRKLEACLWWLWQWLDAFQAYGEVDTNAPLLLLFPRITYCEEFPERMRRRVGVQ